MPNNKFVIVFVHFFFFLLRSIEYGENELTSLVRQSKLFWFCCCIQFQKANQKMRQDVMSSFYLIIRIGSDNALPLSLFFTGWLCVSLLSLT